MPRSTVTACAGLRAHGRETSNERPSPSSHRLGEVGPRIHDWRHFSASVLLGQGVPDNVIAKHTGHKSKELERYKHLFPELRQQTVQLIDKEVKIPTKKK